MKVSIVIPTLNEEKNLPIVLEELKKMNCIDEIIVVDGHSEDRTVDIAKKFSCKIIYDDKGKGSALRKGMNMARGGVVVNMDADCSMIPKEILLLKAGIEAGYDVCMGSRFIQGGGTEDMPLFRKMGNKFFVLLVNSFWGMNYSDLCYGYRAFRKYAIKDLDLKRNGFGIETEISIKAAKRGLKILEVPSFEKSRKYGRGNLRTFKDGWNILNTIFYEFFKRGG